MLEHIQRLGLDVILVDQFGRLFIGQQLECIGNFDFACLFFVLIELTKHATQLFGHLLHASRTHDLKLRRGVRHLDLDLPLIELTFTQLFPEVLPCRALRLVGLHHAKLLAGHRNQDIQHPVLGDILSTLTHLLFGRLAGLLDGNVSQIPDDGVDIFANITHFGELGGFDLDEGRIRQACQTARDFRLADTGGANHENILGRDFAAQAGIHLLAAPAIAQGNRHRAFGLSLADDVFVELCDNFLGSER